MAEGAEDNTPVRRRLRPRAQPPPAAAAPPSPASSSEQGEAREAEWNDAALRGALRVSSGAAAAEDCSLLLGARWREFGRHAYCALPAARAARARPPPLQAQPPAAARAKRPDATAAHAQRADGNGQPRPLLRGWLHLFFLLYCTAVLGGVRASPVPLHATARRFTAWTLVGYAGSVLFHMAPWATQRAYTLALVFDFVAIQLSFTGQIGSLVGWGHAACLASALLTLWLLALCAAGLAGGAVMWQYRRHTRKCLVLGQIGLSMLVEASVIRHKPTALVIGSAKFLGFHWFAAYARFDAPRSSGLVLPGVWHDHDNFHVIATATHALQIWATSTQAGW